MNYSLKILPIILVFTFACSCVAQKATRKKNSKYAENLSKVQPTYSYNLDSILITNTVEEKTKFTPLYSENKELKPIFDSIVTLNNNFKFTRGYRVLVFSGNAQDDALEVRKVILEIFEKDENKHFHGNKVDFIYHQPMFRIKVGEFKTRLEAVRMAEFLKSQSFNFGEDSKIIVNPLVVPDNIEIRK